MSLDEDIIKKEWVKRVKELMPKKGFKTYQDLAYASGVSAGSLNQAMRGLHLPRQTTIDKIATALGTTSQFLMYGDTMKVVSSLPLLYNAGQIWQWVYGDRGAFESLNYLEMDSGLDVSPGAFCWMVDKHDMVPVFYPRDLLIVEPRDIDDPALLAHKNPRYFVGVEFSDGHPSDTIFGQACMTSSGLYLVSEHEKIPGIKLEPVQYQIAGHVVQMVRTFI